MSEKVISQLSFFTSIIIFGMLLIAIGMPFVNFLKWAWSISSLLMLFLVFWAKHIYTGLVPAVLAIALGPIALLAVLICAIHARLFPTKEMEEHV